MQFGHWFLLSKISQKFWQILVSSFINANRVSLMQASRVSRENRTKKINKNRVKPWRMCNGAKHSYLRDSAGYAPPSDACDLTDNEAVLQVEWSLLPVFRRKTKSEASLVYETNKFSRPPKYCGFIKPMSFCRSCRILTTNAVVVSEIRMFIVSQKILRKNGEVPSSSSSTTGWAVVVFRWSRDLSQSHFVLWRRAFC